LQSDTRQKKSLLTSDHDPVREVNDDKYDAFVRSKASGDDVGKFRGAANNLDTVVYVVLGSIS
jgi:hypothetical protein